MIEWFKAIKNKKNYSFISFDIEEFYPSISQDLLNRVLDFASAYDVTNNEETSCNTCKTVDPYAQKSNLGKRRSIQHLKSQWAATTVLKHASL